MITLNEWGDKTEEARNRTGQHQHGFTLVELLVVIFIIGVLMSLLFPALNAAREASRASVCQNNLRQFGVGFAQHAISHQTLCTGAFDWKLDGCVTEIGWVADLVHAGMVPGKMLCPSNPCRAAATYNDLLNLDPSSVAGIDLIGRIQRMDIDGETVLNPCRIIVEDSLPAGESRQQLVAEAILAEHYNTNYTPSWYLVRSGALLDKDGNLRQIISGAGDKITSRNTTRGPLTRVLVDTSRRTSASLIPLMGCGAAAGSLDTPLGDIDATTPLSASLTLGPVDKATMQVPTFDDGTPATGDSGWIVGWASQSLQDYRAFSPVHRGACNILFADGSVRSFVDENGDGLLNNGFTSTSENGFEDDEIELPKTEVVSRWSLTGK